MDVLVDLHHKLIELSELKTDLLKKGSLEELQGLLVKERKLIRKTEQAEADRIQAVNSWFQAMDVASEDKTISTILEIAKDGHEKNELATVTTVLTQAITKLKQLEQLNHALINQSMQFVQLSLDVMSPTIRNINYGNKNEKNTDTAKRSVFDSKA